MDNNNLLQRCETLEADFSALGNYFEKRDFIKRFINDLNVSTTLKDYDKFKAESVIDRDTVFSRYPENVYELFLDSIDGEKKIKFVAYYKAKELIRIEFEKIRPAVMCELTANIIIGLYEDDIENDYRELMRFANLLESQKTQQSASTLFFKKCNTGGSQVSSRMEDVNYDWSECLSKVSDKYFVGTFIDRYSIQFDLENEGFLEKHKINYNDLAFKIKEHITEIRNDEPTPPTTTQTPTGGKEIDYVSNSENPKPLTENDLLKELENITSVLIWLQVTGKLDTVIIEYKKGKQIRDKLVGDGHFKHLIDNKIIDNTPAKNGGRLSKAINLLVSNKVDNVDKPKHKNYPFSYSKVTEFNVYASSDKYRHLGLEKKAKELINNYNEPI